MQEVGTRSLPGSPRRGILRPHFPFKSGPVRPGRETTRCSTISAPPRMLEEAFPCEHDPRSRRRAPCPRADRPRDRRAGTDGRPRPRRDRRPRGPPRPATLAGDRLDRGRRDPGRRPRHHVLSRRHRAHRRSARGPRDADPVRHRGPDGDPGGRRPVHRQDGPRRDGRAHGPGPRAADPARGPRRPRPSGAADPRGLRREERPHAARRRRAGDGDGGRRRGRRRRPGSDVPNEPAGGPGRRRSRGPGHRRSEARKSA